jgi:hypothetical protein
VKERPILFSAPMVRAILDGRKSQTRRAVRHALDHECAHPPTFFDQGGSWACSHCGHGWDERFRCPYGAPGDRLWVRESGCFFRHPEGNTVCAYRAHWDRTDQLPWTDSTFMPQRWTPSIHMPRWASRITLEVTGIRVERLQAISNADAAAEGIDVTTYCGDGVGAYRNLWEAINGAGSWDANPWVWVVEFKHCLAARQSQEAP